VSRTERRFSCNYSVINVLLEKGVNQKCCQSYVSMLDVDLSWPLNSVVLNISGC